MYILERKEYLEPRHLFLVSLDRLARLALLGQMGKVLLDGLFLVHLESLESSLQLSDKHKLL